MKTKVFYGWWIVLATNIICMFGYGTWIYSFGVFFKPMSEEFGWSRAMTSGAYALRSVEGGIASPVVGWAVDKYGSRILILLGGVVSGFAFILMSTIHSLLGFYLIYGVLLSVGMSFMLYLPAWNVIAQWFNRRLSLALAILTSGAGFGGLICAPLAAVLISRFGWRSAFIFIGVLIWCLVIPLALVVRERPEEMGLLQDGDVLDTPRPGDKTVQPQRVKATIVEGSDTDYTLREALQSSAFWFLSMAFFFAGMAQSTVIVHTVPALTDAGIPRETAAFSIGFLTLVSVIGRLGFGFLGDHIDKRYLFMVCYGMMGSGLLVLITADTIPLVWLFLLLFGVGYGGSIPLMPGIRTEYFGRRALGKIQGVMNPIMLIAGATGSVIAGYLFDVTGTYHLVFKTIGLMTFLGAVSVFLVHPKRKLHGDH